MEDEEDDEEERLREDDDETVIGLLQDLHTKVTADADAEVEASNASRNGVMTRRRSRPPITASMLRQMPPSRTMPPRVRMPPWTILLL